MTKSSALNPTAIYQSKTGALQVKTDTKNDTIWLTQAQLATLFNVQKAAISKHLKNIFSSGELNKKSTVSKMETVQQEGNRNVVRNIEHYNLDLVLSIGYRVNSKQATQFRKWATKTLKSHIIDGYTINKHRIQNNHEQFRQAINDIKLILAPQLEFNNDSIIALINLFADTWLTLDAYDKNQLTPSGITTKKKITVTVNKLLAALKKLKANLIDKNEASEFFGVEKEKNSITSIFSNVFQSFSGDDLYSSIEEKAAHLLYFMIKNHPFIDGNKRCAAYAFVWFLQQYKLLDTSQLTPPALTATTLLIAKSSPKDKDRVIGLICNILSKKSKS